MATPSSEFVYGVVDTPNAEEVSAGHPMVWDAVNQRWIDVKDMQAQVDAAAAGQPMPADAVAANPTTTWLNDNKYPIIAVIVIAAIAGTGVYMYTKKK